MDRILHFHQLAAAETLAVSVLVEVLQSGSDQVTDDALASESEPVNRKDLQGRNEISRARNEKWFSHH